MILVLLISTAILSVLLHIYISNAKSYWKKRGVPTINDSLVFATRIEEIHDVISEHYTKMKADGHRYAGINFAFAKVFLPIDAQLIKQLLTKDAAVFNDRAIYHDEKNDPLSAHIISLNGPKWKILRTKLTPAFTAGKVKMMFESIQKCGSEMVKVLQAECAQDKLIDIRDVSTRFTTDVIGSFAFGVDCNSLKNPHSEFRQMGRRAFSQTPKEAVRILFSSTFPRIARFLQLKVFDPKVSEFFKGLVNATVSFREKNNVSRKDFMQALIQLKNKGHVEGDDSDCDGVKLTLNEISAQVVVFFLAGFETTAANLSFAMFELAQNHHIQTKARDEIRAVIAKYNGVINYDSVLEMEYLETIVLESLRKYPPLPVFRRKCKERYNVPNTSVFIEKGTIALIPVMAVHWDPEYYPQPEVYDPERFSKENKYKVKEQCYLPFGDGPRNCMGMRLSIIESKFALAMILHNFQLDLSDTSFLPLKLEMPFGVLTPTTRIKLQLTPITPNCH